MAHEFESGVFALQPAWHQLGVVLDEYPDIDTAFMQSGLNWEVETESLFFRKQGQKRSFGTDMNVLLRDKDNMVLGYCKGQYQIFQNKEAFEWCRPLVETGMWNIESAGSLKQGKTPWILLKQNEEEFIPNDKMKQYLLVQVDHTGKKSNVVMPTTIRVVCNNTLQMALREGNVTRINHGSSMLDKYNEIQQYWQATTAQFSKQTEVFKMLLDMPMTNNQLEDSVIDLFPIPEQEDGKSSAQVTIAKKKQDVVMRYVMGEATGHDDLGIKNTGYGMLMGVSEAVEHVVGGNRIKDRGVYVMEGQGKQEIDKTFDYLLSKVATVGTGAKELETLLAK